MIPEIDEIKVRRKQLGITQEQLAALAGVSQSLVTKVEAGRIVPSYTKAKHLFEVLETRSAESSLCASDVMQGKVISAKPSSTVNSAVRLMRQHSVSQIPVMENSIVVGSFSEKHIVERMHSGMSLEKMGTCLLGGIMGEAMPIIQENTPLSLCSSLLEHNQAVIVARKGRVSGIITKADLLNVLLMGRRMLKSRVSGKHRREQGER